MSTSDDQGERDLRGAADAQRERMPRPANIPPPSSKPPHITTKGYPPPRRD